MEFKWNIWIPKFSGIQMKPLNSRIFVNSNEAFEFPNSCEFNTLEFVSNKSLNPQNFENSNETFEFPNFREFKWNIWIPEFSGIQMKHLNSRIFGNSNEAMNSQIFGNSNEAFELPNFREFKWSIWIPEFSGIEKKLVAEPIAYKHWSIA